jgi:branched-chain amino acid transport system ATP-binding protein
LKVADRAYVLENGRVAFSGLAEELRNDTALREAYLGS